MVTGPDVEDRSDPWPTWRSNVLWGVYIGITVAAILSLYAWILSLDPNSRALERAEVTLDQAVRVYFAGGLGGGLLLGLSRPFLKTLVGQMIVGSLVIAPLFFALEWATDPRPLGQMLKNVVILSVLLGPVYAICWRIYDKLWPSG